MDGGVSFQVLIAIGEELHNINQEVSLLVSRQVKGLSMGLTGTDCKTILEIDHQGIAINEVHTYEDRDQHARFKPIFMNLLRVRQGKSMEHIVGDARVNGDTEKGLTPFATAISELGPPFRIYDHLS